MANVTDVNTQPGSLAETIDLLIERTAGHAHVTVGDVLEIFGRQAFGPLILVPALLLTLPTGALPGVPLALGALIALISVEMLIGRKTPAIPSLFSKLKFSRKALIGGRKASAKVIAFVDRHVRPRLNILMRSPFLQLLALVNIGLSLLLIPVEIIPFATAIPGAALILLGLAITLHDGLVAAAGLAAAALAGGGVWMLAA